MVNCFIYCVPVDEQQNESLSDSTRLLHSVFQDLQLSSNLENTAAK